MVYPLMSIRKIYASVATTTVAAVTLELLRPSRLLALVWTVVPSSGFAAAGVYQVGEISRTGTSQYTTSDTLEPVDQCAVGGLETTSGHVPVVNRQVMLDVPLKVGDRLYFHVTASGTGTALWSVFLHLRD